MARKPGTPSYSTEQAATLTDLPDIAQEFGNLASRLQGAAGSTQAGSMPLEDFMNEVATARDKLANYERALAEFALHREGLTQRTAAHLLNVGVSTISRWSQLPIYFERSSEP